jgi:flagellar export protein FliJ
MSGLATLIEFAERRVGAALSGWQRLRAQCDEAKQKLLVLKQHGEGYSTLMHSDLREGMSATSMMAHVGFIKQIEAVVIRQENEIGSLEEGCGRLWQELVEARREKRTYEILSERAKMRKAETASRREQAETDELLQRAVKTS